MKLLFSLTMLFIPLVILGQNNELSMFGHLAGKTWKAEGNWGDGSKFSQEIEIDYALNGAIVVTKSFGFVDKEQTKTGLRNHGIRQFDKTTNTIKFWEFDVFGEVTEGIVFNKGKDIIYQYSYGNTKVSDMWAYINDSTYNFIVGEYKDGQWLQTYLKTTFKRLHQHDIEEIYTIAKNSLAGRWVSPAWDGQLEESWSVDEHGHLIQSAEYTENQKVLFASKNKIEIVDHEIILISVIKGSNPKIYKATSWSKRGITFENSDYSNPNKVIYQFVSKDEFHRSISGIENNEASSYTFKFKPLE